MKLWIALLGVAALLLLRAATDHSANTHYTGDFGAEKDFLTAARHFEARGFAESAFLPVFRSRPYTHYPPGPYLINGVPYVLSGGSEFAARMPSVAITLIGLVFAWKAIGLLLRRLELSPPPFVEWGIFALLAGGPAVLCFGDTASLQPMTEALQWASLYWVLRYLFEGASLRGGVALAFLHVWISFEWIVGMMLILGYCLWTLRGPPRERRAEWLAVFGLGFALPVAMRIAQNAWALGGLDAALADLFSVARVRGAVDAASGYSAGKHAVKFLVALPWFAGVPVLLLVLVGARAVWSRAAADRRLLAILALWGIGSLSWQLLMRQHALVHAFTYLHFANFLVLVAALAAAVLHERRAGFVTLCLIGQWLWAGSLIRSEIVQPFLEDSTRVLAASLCAGDREDLSRSFGTSRSTMIRSIESSLAAAPPAPECLARSGPGLRMLQLYGFVVKSSVGRGA
jgi:hypothetical protein